MDRTKANGVLEDVSAEIGYTATSLLVAWFGGANLYVPAAADESHPVSRLIGNAAFRRLVAAYGGETLWIPGGHLEAMDRRDRLIAERLAAGTQPTRIQAIELLNQLIAAENEGELTVSYLLEAEPQIEAALHQAEQVAQASQRIVARCLALKPVPLPQVPLGF